MLALQLLLGAFLFLSRALSSARALEASFAALLAFSALACSGRASSKPAFRLPLLALKLGLCAVLRPFEPLVLLLAPALLLEPPGVFPPERRFAPLWAFLALAAAAPALLLPRPALPLFFLLWAASCAYAAREFLRAGRAARSAARLRELEKRLAREEAEREAIERSSSGIESLARAAERDRIADLLHDELGRAMTGSIMQLEAATLLFRDEPERAGSLVGKALEALRAGLAAVRASLKALKPGPQALALERMRAALAAFESDHGIAASLSTEGSVEAMPGRIWSVAEANLKEALTNLLRHSDARRFRCRIVELNGMYQIEYHDDGTRAAAFSKGMGLEGMEARAGRAGGSLIVDGSRGFRVTMLFAKGGSEDGYPHPGR